MSNQNFNARRAPNVSQYLANLNTVPNQQDVAQNDFELGNEGLDFLLNTEFFDFDAAFNPNVEFAGQPSQPQEVQPQQHVQRPQQPGPGFQFSEFQAFPQSIGNSPAAIAPSPSTGIQGPFPAQAPAFPAQPATGEKRKASTAQMTPVNDLEEQSRLAAEEDKRRRNTAASARFRVKKKQREQALEKQTKEMSDKVASLEGKVQQLEMENKWLKGLITEKNDVKGINEQFKRFVAQQAEEQKKTEARSTQHRTDGVGTVEEYEKEEIKV